MIIIVLRCFMETQNKQHGQGKTPFHREETSRIRPDKGGGEGKTEQEKGQKEEKDRHIHHMHPGPNSQDCSVISGQSHLTAQLLFHPTFLFLPPRTPWLLHTLKLDTTSLVLLALVQRFSCIVPNEKLL